MKIYIVNELVRYMNNSVEIDNTVKGAFYDLEKAKELKDKLFKDLVKEFKDRDELEEVVDQERFSSVIYDYDSVEICIDEIELT